MISLDTNVLVRLIAEDDPKQLAAAKLAREEGAFVSHGVLMEAEWVLRALYGWPRDRVNRALRQLIGVGGIMVDELEDVFWALDRHGAGGDWADMLHLIASRGHASFATFDRSLLKEAGETPPVPVRVLE